MPQRRLFTYGAADMTETCFHLYTCNNLQALAKAYSQKRKEQRERFCAGGFFAKERICVATKGMGTWLEHYLVQAGHVVANVEFPFIRDVIDGILATFMAGNAAYRPELFKEDVLIWRLYSQLSPQSLKTDDSLKILAAYIEADKQNDTTQCQQTPNMTSGAAVAQDNVCDVRRYQLAQKLAQLYYDYMVFVPEKLHPELAPKGMDTAVSDVNRWQIVLWKKLCIAADGTKLVSPAAAMLRFVFGDESLPKDAYTPMTFFGISAMAPYFLWVLRKVATVQPVNFFYLNHCDELWDDVKAHWEKRDEAEDALEKQFNNTLLGEFGTQGRQFFKAIMDLDTDVVTHELADERLEEWENNSGYDKLERTGNIPLLQDIQTRILRNTEEAVTSSARPQAQDDSLTIHSCFNDIREVEALHDCLLQLISEYKASGKSLAMNDIIVMAPDIARFAPTIHAVFAKGPLKSRYCISDRSVKSASLMAETFQTIMTLHKSRFEISRISRLLDAPPLRARFGFDDDAVQKLRDWFRKAGIRWGRDKKDRGSDDVAFEEYSWQYGLDRLLLKIAVDGKDDEGDDIIGFGGLNPVDTSMGQDSQHLLNGLCRFYNELREFVDEIQQATDKPRSGADWCDFLLEKRAAFFRADSTSAQEYSHLGRTCTDMKAALETAGCSEPLPYEVIVSAMSSKLDAPAQGEPFLNGKITFCSLLPMRGIPCKVIALLGMDVGEFPRQNDATSYNLVLKPVGNGQGAGGSNKDSKSGNLLKYYDRSRSIEDRFTFLEALMSAQDYLMIFYKGQDDQTLEDLVAAAPVVELLNYVRKIRAAKKGTAWPLVKHALNAFDPKAFASVLPINNAGDDTNNEGKQPSGALLKPFSYDREMWRVATQLFDKRKHIDQEIKSEDIVEQEDTATDNQPAEEPEEAAPRHEMWLDLYQLSLPETLPRGWQVGQPLTIDLADLIQFYRNPQDAYVTSRLGLPKEAWEEEQLSDYEPFKLSSLEAYMMKKDLAVKQLVAGAFAPFNEQSDDAVKQVYHGARGRCELPTGAMSQVEFISQQINCWITDPQFRKEWKEQENSEEEDFSVSLGDLEATLPDELYNAIKAYSDWGDAFPRPTAGTFNVTLTGRFKYLRASEERPCGLRTCFNVNDLHGRHFHPFYLKHLLLAAAKENETVSSIYYENAFGGSAKLENVAAENPSGEDLLKSLVSTYMFGLLYPIPVLGRSSMIGSKGALKPAPKNDLLETNAAFLFDKWPADKLEAKANDLLILFINYLFPSLGHKEKKEESKSGKKGKGKQK